MICVGDIVRPDIDLPIRGIVEKIDGNLATIRWRDAHFVDKIQPIDSLLIVKRRN